MIDTTTLTNGLHTISWVVTDDQGATEGIGSRFFTVSNGAGGADGGAAASAGAATAARGRLSASADIERCCRSIARRSLGRRGWDLDAPLRAFEPGDRAARRSIRSEEVIASSCSSGRAAPRDTCVRRAASRPARRLAARRRHGRVHLGAGRGLRGRVRFVFVRWRRRRRRSRVRTCASSCAPKGSGLVGPQVVIDMPRSQQDVAAAVRARRAGRRISSAPRDGYRDAARVGVSAGGWTAGVPRRDGLRRRAAGCRGRARRQFRDRASACSVQGLAARRTTIWRFSRGASKPADFAPAKVVRITVR